MDFVSALSAALADRYAIDREIGRGGMATVYLARDLKHDRNVALKVLNPELGAVLGVERFLAEIKVTANLQHPNLLPLFDSGEAAGLLFYVMPYVEGESLRARIDREKQLPVDEAVRIAIAIGSALEYAHAAGVIHRDLKPENILMQAGQPVIADFGIALAVSNAGGARVTQTGLSLGTPQYMSPEQASGDRAIDARTDLYSLGAITYEMLTGEPPHVGTTAQAIIAKLMTEEPRPLAVLRKSVPEGVDDAVRRALEKLPADRWATAKEFIDALRAGGSSTGARSHAGSRARGHRGSRGLKVLMAVGFAIAGFSSVGWWTAAHRHDDGTPVRFALGLPSGFRIGAFVSGTGSNFAISPDGKSIVYVGNAPSAPQALHLRRIDELDGHTLPNTDVGFYPFFSPDGKKLGFFVSDPKMLDLATGTVTPLVTSNVGRGNVPSAAFADNEHVVFETRRGIELGTVGTTDARVVQPFDDPSLGSRPRNPFVLADGKTMLFAYGKSAEPTLAVRSLDGRGQARALGLNGVMVVGVLDGYLLFVTPQGTVQAVPFDAGSATVRGGAPITVIDHVAVGPSGAQIALSASGTLMYQPGNVQSQVVVADLHGAIQPLLKDAKDYTGVRLSPDGKKIALSISTAGASDIYTYDFTSKTQSKLTANGGDRPEWSADGSRVVFRTSTAGPVSGAGFALWWQRVDGGGAAELLVQRPEGDVWEGVMTPDGKSLFIRTGTVNNARLWVRGMTGDTATAPFHESTISESAMRFSADGRWMAYNARVGDTREVFVLQTRDPNGARTQISDGGGDTPLWSRDGRRIFYTRGQKIYMASVAPGANGALTVTDRKELFETDASLVTGHAGFDVMPDGEHLVLMKPVNGGSPPIVVHNWRAELHALVNARGAK